MKKKSAFMPRALTLAQKMFMLILLLGLVVMCAKSGGGYPAPYHADDNGWLWGKWRSTESVVDIHDLNKIEFVDLLDRSGIGREIIRIDQGGEMVPAFKREYWFIRFDVVMGPHSFREKVYYAGILNQKPSLWTWSQEPTNPGQVIWLKRE